ncbi:uncharacterized protein LOC142339968 [Convolutriloba macropyga]|uniref:uncharacterized protein LOC142339968 n=1 Tax=Convolutriloba macropyga TaxID=536237 RepID=UPI003F524131
MASPSQKTNDALLETDYCQSPSGQSVSYVLKQSLAENQATAIGSPKLASPYASKQGLSQTEINQKMEKTTARREMLMEDIKTKRREHSDHVNQVRRSLVEKELTEQEQKMKQIEEKLLTAQENKMKDIEMIKDKCYKEDRKVELAHARRMENSGRKMGDTPDSQEDMEN